MKTIRGEAIIPNGGYTYKNVEDGYEIKSPYLHKLRTLVKEYREANNFPIGSDFNRQFESNICENSGESACIDTEPPTLIKRLATFGLALANHARHGFQVTTPEEVDKRISICEDCPNYNGSTGLLRINCKACGCFGIKLWMKEQKCVLNPPRW